MSRNQLQLDEKELQILRDFEQGGVREHETLQRRKAETGRGGPKYPQQPLPALLPVRSELLDQARDKLRCGSSESEEKGLLNEALEFRRVLTRIAVFSPPPNAVEVAMFADLYWAG